MAARSDAVRPRRRRAAGPRPLAEHQLAEVRRAVLALSGSGARSVKMHGLVVYLDKELTQPQVNPLTRSAPMPASQTDGAARTQRPEQQLTSRQRRSRRRLEERIAGREKERPPQPRGGDERAATLAATGRVQGAPGGSSPRPAGPAPSTSSKGPPVQTRAVHPARARGQPAQSDCPKQYNGRSGSSGDGARARGGKGGQAHADAASIGARQMPSAGKQPVGRRRESSGCSDYMEQELSPDELVDD